jgi:hypothetical protein
MKIVDNNVVISPKSQLFKILKAMAEDEYSEPLIERTSKGEIVVYTGLVKNGHAYQPGKPENLKGK